MSENYYIAGNGYVYSLESHTGNIVWETKLNSGFLKSGHQFVSLKETQEDLYAFCQGKLFILSKVDGSIIHEGEVIKNLKNHPGVFAGENSSSNSGVSFLSSTSDEGGSGGDC